jgi:threonyl-tRNA synthetase
VQGVVKMEQDSGGQGEKTALLLLGCPEVPVQMGIALYLAGRLEKSGIRVTVAGNPSVIQLARVSDPDQHYVKRMMNLEKAMADLIEGRVHPDITVAFAHNDAGISYAATVRHVSPCRLYLIIFGREAEELAGLAEFDCEKIVERAVHNPGQLKKKIDKVFGWAASRS